MELDTSTLALQIVECRQVRKRLTTLLPDRLQQVQKKCRTPYTRAGAARRKALVHPEYQQHLDELVRVKGLYHSLKLEWDHRSMQRATGVMR